MNPTPINSAIDLSTKPGGPQLKPVDETSYTRFAAIEPHRDGVSITSNDVLLNVQEARRRLGVSVTTVYALMSGGSLTSIKVGRARRIRESSLLALMSAGTQA